MTDAADWIELKRYDDATEAEIALNFLREHGVTAALRGHRGLSGLLGQRGDDVRLAVPAGELEPALEALEALGSPVDLALCDAADGTGDEYGVGPYRAARRSAPSDLAVAAPRRKHLAFILGCLVPVGGGHFYARHHSAGRVFGGAIGLCFIAGMISGAPWLITAAMLVVLADAVGSVTAVTRYQAGRVPSGGRQVAYAAVASTLCVLAAYAARGVQRGHEARSAPIAAFAPAAS